ncbi:SIR2 family protein [Rhizobium leucaenae]|uniref:NAD-dependent SIR2 family protein deacetylase n=1 Tax=Rhizobium leucaenae TaxID=29450 RepID=A0A7W6ZYQ9_9HYPH|nr:SIR2 family protein [Rhizobium leucaenae]MBB4570687.1 NAD-dependent SIR2 family protein deacetylase [Rhizobium leucaenae]
MSACDCAFCRNEIEFALPPDFLDRLVAGRCVIFAGAGISTENRTHCKTTFYEKIQTEMGVSDSGLDFPSLMTQYCGRVDGRINLIKKIRERIEYFRSFRGFYVPMTRFHRALRPLYMIEDVITTNWDDFFEEESGLRPFVYDQDLPFIESSPRRLIKIHGSISNAGSIVATKDDYKKALLRLEKGALGAYLETLLSTKTIVYIGYSLKDSNYLSIIKSLNKIMGKFSRSSYFVSPNIDYDYLKSTNLSLIPIETDGSFFLEQLRLHINQKLCNHQQIIDDVRFDFCEDFLPYVNEAHHRAADIFIETRKPIMTLVLSYQDGLQDALMRITDTRSSGEYYNSERVRYLLHAYEKKVETYVSESNYWDACYCRGYQNGLMLLLATGEDGVPPLVDLCFADNIDTIPKALRLARKRIPSSVLEEIERITAEVGEGLIPEHIPYV